MSAKVVFRMVLRVYADDTDFGGVVYHGRYLNLFDRARSEWLRSRGLTQEWLLRERSLLFAVTEVSIRFRRPARLDDELTLQVAIAEIRNASMALEQKIWRDETLLSQASVRVASVDANAWRAVKFPDDLRSILLDGD